MVALLFCSTPPSRISIFPAGKPHALVDLQRTAGDRGAAVVGVCIRENQQARRPFSRCPPCRCRQLVAPEITASRGGRIGIVDRHWMVHQRRVEIDAVLKRHHVGRRGRAEDERAGDGRDVVGSQLMVAVPLLIFTVIGPSHGGKTAAISCC